MNFHNIHPFLKERAKWAVWRYEQREGKAKPDKPPRSPYGDNPLISSTSDEGWGSFEDAVTRFGDGVWWHGIGFRLSPELGVTVVDLDYNENHNADVFTLHRRIYDKLASWTEFSPSGKGVHIVTFGSVPSRRNPFGVEVYSRDRFMTATGNVLFNGEIVNRQFELEQLVEQMGGERKPKPVIDENAPAKEPDEAIIARGYSAANGDKFRRLWEGDWRSLGYPSQSEADFALINMLCCYSPSPAQVRRLFFQSALGQRDKLIERPELLEQIVTRGYDNVLPEIDTTALRLQLEQKLEQSRNALVAPAVVGKHGNTISDALQPPPGLFGRIAQFYYQAGSYPAPEIALAGAIGFMSGLCGSGWNVNGMGLNTFTLLTAPTAAGKDVLTSGTHRLINACTAFKAEGQQSGALEYSTLRTMMGPSVIHSGQALVKALKTDFQSMLSIQSEFYIELGKFSDKNINSATAALKKMYLSLVGNSGKDFVLGKEIWSDKDQNTEVRRGISFSILAESVPERVYSELNEDQIADGFVTRMLLVELPHSLELFNPQGPMHMPDDALIRDINAVSSMGYSHSYNKRPADVNFSPEAMEVLEGYRRECRAKHTGPDKPVSAGLWARCHIKALKLAALCAVGNNYQNPIIQGSDARWAIEVVNRGTNALLTRFERGEIGRADSHAHKVGALEKFVRRYVELPLSELPRPRLQAAHHQAKQVSYNYLRANAKAAEFKEPYAFDNALKTMVNAGWLVPLPQTGEGKAGLVYQITQAALDA